MITYDKIGMPKTKTLFYKVLESLSGEHKTEQLCAKRINAMTNMELLSAISDALGDL